MKRRLPLVLGSLAGAAAIHVALVACSSTTIVKSVGQDGDANAQTSPTGTGAATASCSQWQVQSFLPSTFTFKTVSRGGTDNGTIDLPYFDAFTLPAGWEPIGAGDYGAVTARKCVAP